MAHHQLDPFPYDELSIKSLEESISVGRLSTYRRLVGNKKVDDALDLYALNAKLSGTFLLPLQAVEITLRNRCNNSLSDKFGPTWLTDGSLKLHKWQIDQVRLKARLPVPHPADVYNFGFWQTFFARRYYQLWESTFQHFFAIKPKTLNRAVFMDKLERIRLFRNRIAHHEQIISQDPLARYADMRDLISWLDPAQAAWLDHYCQVPAVWAEVEQEKATRGWVGF